MDWREHPHRAGEEVQVLRGRPLLCTCSPGSPCCLHPFYLSPPISILPVSAVPYAGGPGTSEVLGSSEAPVRVWKAPPSWTRWAWPGEAPPRLRARVGGISEQPLPPPTGPADTREQLPPPLRSPVPRLGLGTGSDSFQAEGSCPWHLGLLLSLPCRPCPHLSRSSPPSSSWPLGRAGSLPPGSPPGPV